MVGVWSVLEPQESCKLGVSPPPKQGQGQGPPLLRRNLQSLSVYKKEYGRRRQGQAGLCASLALTYPVGFSGCYGGPGQAASLQLLLGGKAGVEPGKAAAL